jgi:uncharacterized MAPEG superfamily protein
VVVATVIGLAMLRGTARQLFLLGAAAVIIARLAYLGVV